MRNGQLRVLRELLLELGWPLPHSWCCYQGLGCSRTAPTAAEIIVQPTDRLEILLLKDGPALPRHWEPLRKASPSLGCRQHMKKAKQ